MVNPKLRAAVESFRPHALRDGYHTPRGARNACTEASNDFLCHLEAFDFEAQIEHFDPTITQDSEDYPLIMADCKFHWAVRVDAIVIDWTARQFTTHADFPLIWACPQRDWRNC